MLGFKVLGGGGEGFWVEGLLRLCMGFLGNSGVGARQQFLKFSMFFLCLKERRANQEGKTEISLRLLDCKLHGSHLKVVDLLVMSKDGVVDTQLGSSQRIP